MSEFDWNKDALEIELESMISNASYSSGTWVSASAGTSISYEDLMADINLAIDKIERTKPCPIKIEISPSLYKDVVKYSEDISGTKISLLTHFSGIPLHINPNLHNEVKLHYDSRQVIKYVIKSGDINFLREVIG